jgi:hypothetical protein
MAPSHVPQSNNRTGPDFSPFSPFPRVALSARAPRPAMIPLESPTSSFSSSPRVSRSRNSTAFRRGIGDMEEEFDGTHPIPVIRVSMGTLCTFKEVWSAMPPFLRLRPHLDSNQAWRLSSYLSRHYLLRYPNNARLWNSPSCHSPRRLQLPVPDTLTSTSTFCWGPLRYYLEQCLWALQPILAPNTTARSASLWRTDLPTRANITLSV